MKSIWKWTGLFLGVFSIALLIGLSFFGRGGFGWMPMMTQVNAPWAGFCNGYQFSHMFGGFGFLGGWFMMLGMFILPLAVLGLLIVGGIVLVKGVIRPQTPALVVARTCVHCGKALQQDWVNCPFCGEKV